jgi:hypothetical protein
MVKRIKTVSDAGPATLLTHFAAEPREFLV